MPGEQIALRTMGLAQSPSDHGVNFPKDIEQLQSASGDCNLYIVS
jgi:hypothetical protein